MSYGSYTKFGACFHKFRVKYCRSPRYLFYYLLNKYIVEVVWALREKDLKWIPKFVIKWDDGRRTLRYKGKDGVVLLPNGTTENYQYYCRWCRWIQKPDYIYESQHQNDNFIIIKDWTNKPIPSAIDKPDL